MGNTKPMVDYLGIDTAHPMRTIDRPHGTPDYLLVFFFSRFESREDGKPYHGRPGDCLIQSPYTPSYFSSLDDDPEGYRDDWCFVRGGRFREMVDSYDLPVDRFIHTDHPLLLRDLFFDLEQELRDKPAFMAKSIQQLLDRMLLRIARASEEAAKLHGMSRASQAHLVKFRGLRERMLSDVAVRWSVTSLARAAGLSSTRFTVLYREFFGVSPIEDLTEARIRKAKALLVGGNQQIGQIAILCGFSSIYHFSRIFKTREGCAPSHY